MKLILLFTLNLGLSFNLYAGNCKTPYPQVLLFCDNTFTYYVDVIQIEDLDELITGTPEKRIQQIYLEESIRYISDKINDERFYYEGDTATGTVDFYSPQDGYFEILNVWMDNQEFTHVQWHDVNYNSYTLLFENPESYKLLYIQHEN